MYRSILLSILLLSPLPPCWGTHCQSSQLKASNEWIGAKTGADYTNHSKVHKIESTPIFANWVAVRNT